MKNNEAGNFNPSEAPSICAKKGSEGVLVVHEKCNKYYICVTGTPLARPCPNKLLFNPRSNDCDWPKRVDCGSRIIPGEENDDGNEEDDGSGAGNDDPTLAAVICARKHSNGILVAHQKCNKYYICDNGRPEALRCPKHLLFNPKADICDWPNKVDCGNRIILAHGDDQDIEETESEDNNDNESGNDDPSKALSICAEKGSTGVLVAHKKCNKYYLCDHNKPVAFSCPENLLFNPKHDKCDWPEKVDCGDRKIPGENDEDDVDNHDCGAGNCDPSEAPYLCARKGSDGVLIAHEICNKFYICLSSKPVALSCPENLVFNSAIDQCDYPENVNCAGRLIPEADKDSVNDDPRKAPKICAKKNSDGVLVAHENCNQFYICNHQQPVSLTCPVTLLYNPRTEQCDWPNDVFCGDRIIPTEK